MPKLSLCFQLSADNFHIRVRSARSGVQPHRRLDGRISFLLPHFPPNSSTFFLSLFFTALFLFISLSCLSSVQFSCFKKCALGSRSCQNKNTAPTSERLGAKLERRRTPGGTSAFTTRPASQWPHGCVGSALSRPLSRVREHNLNELTAFAQASALQLRADPHRRRNVAFGDL